jgi:deazaflavin-dependent oxidoreductase (nitroreductase family)
MDNSSSDRPSPAVVWFGQASTGQRLVRRVSGTRAGSWLSARLLHRLDGPVLARTAGRRSVTTAMSGLPMVQLTCTGARTGRARTVPVMGLPDGDRLVLVASNYGSVRNPAWYLNLVAHPACVVTAGGADHRMRAYQSEGAERERLWALACAMFPPMRRYALRADGRRIPVMVLEPAQPGTDLQPRI